MSLASGDSAGFGHWVPVIFPFWVCFILFVLSRVSGWSALAQKYAATGAISGTTFSVHGHTKNMKPHSGLKLTIAREGLLVALGFPFRLFHPPLLLPWSGVQTLEQNKEWSRALLLVFEGEGVQFDFYVPLAAREAIREAAGPRFAAFDRPLPS